MADRWYVAQAVAGLEAVAEGDLRRLGFRAEVPRFRGEWPSPVYPGYVFVELDVDGPGWAEVREAKGFVHLLPRHLERPSPLPDGFVEALGIALDSGAFGPGEAEEIVRSWSRGEVVEIVAGAFAGHLGRVDGKRRGEVLVVLALLGREHTLGIAPQQLQPGSISAAREPTVIGKTRAPQYGSSARHFSRRAAHA